MEEKKLVKINWAKRLTEYTEIETSKNSYLDAFGFYSILSGVYDIKSEIFREITLLYISHAYPQTIREILLQHLDFQACMNRFLQAGRKRKALIMGGKIINSTEVLSQNLFISVEHCLVNTNQPVCNSSYIENTSGNIIEIINEGNFFPLKEKAICRI